MKCPRCNSDRTRVTNTYPYDEVRRATPRRRVCGDCRFAFRTYEADSPDVAGRVAPAPSR